MDRRVTERTRQQWGRTLADLNKNRRFYKGNMFKIEQRSGKRRKVHRIEEDIADFERTAPRSGRKQISLSQWFPDSPGHLVEMQILGSHIRPSESEPLGLGPPEGILTRPPLDLDLLEFVGSVSWSIPMQENLTLSVIIRNVYAL